MSEAVRGRTVLVAANKMDRGGGPALQEAAALAAAAGSVEVSALTGEGLDALQAALVELLLGDNAAPESVWVSNARHIEKLRGAAAALERAIGAAGAAFDEAAVALDLPAWPPSRWARSRGRR